MGRVMAQGINRLSARAVNAAKEPGLVADGGGLYLQVARSGAKSWIWKFMLNGRSREMGLGPSPVLRARSYRARLAFRGPRPGGHAPMEFAPAPTLNGRVLAKCPPACFARHLSPGQSGPNRVAMPASISSACLVNFIILFPRFRGPASIGFT